MDIMLIFVFVISAFLGIELISKVPSQLHTPLMSGTNAISGITVVGAITVTAVNVGGKVGLVLGFLAIVFATINVIGGYMVSCIFFIRGIKLLGKTDTARKGNLYSSIGMLIACVTVLCEKEVLDSWSLNILENGYFYVAAAILIGGLIGAIAFTGSVVAWGKLSGKMFKKNVAIPGKNIVNAILAFIGLAGIVAYAFFEDTPCGGITFAGFAINNTVLVVSGCLVGASGLILTLGCKKCCSYSWLRDGCCSGTTRSKRIM